MRCARAATLRLRTLRFSGWLSANRAGVIVAGLLVGMMAIAAPTAIAVSPHGDGLIAYSVKTGIYAVRADGTGSRLLVPWQPSTCGKGCVIWKVPRNPRYSPDGRHLTYDMETYVVRHGVGGDAEPDTRTVYVADANGRHRRRLGLGHHPEFSPDGKEVMYLLNPNAYPPLPLLEEPPKYGDDYGPMEAVNIDSGARRTLPVPGASEFSFDGQKMLAVRQVRANGAIKWADTLENIDGSEIHDFFLPAFYAELPRLTANGELSYDCPSPGNRQPDMCLFNTVTGQHRRLLHIHEFWALEAASSPSGRRFAISGLQGLYVTDAQGHHPRLIVRNGSGPNYVDSDVPTSPDWQPIA
jgi:hypothetical protein